MCLRFLKTLKCEQIRNSAVFFLNRNFFTINNPSLVLIAVIDHPPKHNEHFISEFANFLSCFILQYEWILIVGDFNIHICCEDKPVVNDFLNIIDSFHLTHFVAGTTQERGHTLDLVLGHISVNEL